MRQFLIGIAAFMTTALLIATNAGLALA